MYRLCKTINLVLGGGGIKGIAYAGSFDIAEQEGIKWGNIAGVSAGALVGAYASAGYSSLELRKMLDVFDFSKIEINKIYKKVPAVQQFMTFNTQYRGECQNTGNVMDVFLNSSLFDQNRGLSNSLYEFSGYRGNLLKNIITLSKEGCLCDGDYLEEWVYGVLSKKGIKTFGDLRGGRADSKNPKGYRIRMTAVDANRAKVIVLPDDIAFYGVEPDKLEVARAVRMSTCVPFAFKPVEIKKITGRVSRTYYIIDGGVLDNFPSWTMDTSDSSDVFGFRLTGSDKNKLLSIDTPLNVLKALICSVHDAGIDKNAKDLKFIEDVNTGDISFLDFNLSEADKKYLFYTGQGSARRLIKRYKNGRMLKNNGIFSFLNSFRNKTEI
ncbi:MAG: patatin-like phospholipase family protein [Clostridia bacterium]|nr:patatin-like phospholipase family protein [Clostridia bacterium]